MTQDNPVELIAQRVEDAASLLNKEAIADLIQSGLQRDIDTDTIAYNIVTGVHPLFKHIADQIRKTELDLSERDKKIVDLTIQQLHDALFEFVKNPVKNPRKNNNPLKKQGIWWTQISETLDKFRQGSAGLDKANQDAHQQGYAEGIRAAANHVRSLPGYVRDNDQPRSRKPSEYAEAVESMIP